MAKKAKAKTKASYQGDPGDEHVETIVVQETIKPVMETPKPKVKEDDWVIEDKVYYLTNKRRPLSYAIKSAGIYFFDEKQRYERELKYCENQITPFVDEMKGDQRLSHIIFRNGALHVPRNKQTLQKLLSIYHPGKGVLFEEYKPVQEAADEIEWLELEVDALMIAKTMEIEMAEAIMRTESGSKVSNMSSKELRRDLLIFARRNPVLFLDLAKDDNVVLRNFGIKATESGILNLSSDQRTFTWASNSRKLLNVPFDEHPYSALAAWFKTDEGMEIYSNIEKQLQ